MNGQMRRALRERMKADLNRTFYKDTPIMGMESRQMARRRSIKAEEMARKAEFRDAEAEELRVQRAGRTAKGEADDQRS